MSAMKMWRPSGSVSTNVLCAPNVISAFCPRQGLGCCVQGPQMLGAENIRASLGSHPVHPLVIIQYVFPCRKRVGASLCPPGATRM